MKKKVITVVITVLIGIICIMPFSHVKAEGLTGNEYVFYHVSNNIRGSASGYRETTADYYIYNDTTNKKYRGVVNINFAGPVTGTFTLGLPVQFNTSDVVVTENCVVQTNSSTGVWTFKVDGVDSCTVEYYTATTSRGLSSFTGTWSASTDLNDINTTLGQIKGYVDGVESSLTTINNTISTISTNLTTTNTLLAHIDNILKIQTFPIWQSNVLLWANSYSSLSFDLPLPYFYYNYGDNSADWTASHRMSVPSGGTTSLIFYTNSNIQTSNVSMYYPSNYPSVSIQRVGSTVVGGYPYYLVRLDITNTSNSSSTFVELEFNKSFTCYPIFYGSSSLIPDEVMYLFGTDFNNTYTRLLEQIKQGINDISFVNNNTQTIINSNVNNYNDYTTQIHNIENNYITQFNNYKEDITTPTLPTAITNNITNYKSFIDGFFNGVPYIKTILTVILFCFLIICLLGV